MAKRRKQPIPETAETEQASAEAALSPDEGALAVSHDEPKPDVPSAAEPNPPAPSAEPAEKRKRQTASRRPATAAPPPEPEAVDAPRRLFSVAEYLLLNVVFDLFCIVQLVIVRVVLRETRGLYFFFALLMLGFFAVSVFDYIYDRLTARSAQAVPETE